jgi:hypothetical protein
MRGTQLLLVAGLVASAVDGHSQRIRLGHAATLGLAEPPELFGDGGRDAWGCGASRGCASDELGDERQCSLPQSAERPA